MNVATLLTKDNIDGSFSHYYSTKGNESLIEKIIAEKPVSVFEPKTVNVEILDYIEAKQFVDEDGSTGLDLK